LNRPSILGELHVTHGKIPGSLCLIGFFARRRSPIIRPTDKRLIIPGLGEVEG
jgi:hypothetical protein